MIENLSNFFKNLVGVIQDAILFVVDQILIAISGGINSIQVPAFMKSGLGGLWSQLDPTIIYILSECGVPMALSIIGSAFVAKLIKRIVTMSIF